MSKPTHIAYVVTERKNDPEKKDWKPPITVLSGRAGQHFRFWQWSVDCCDRVAAGVVAAADCADQAAAV